MRLLDIETIANQDAEIIFLRSAIARYTRLGMFQQKLECVQKLELAKQRIAQNESRIVY